MILSRILLLASVVSLAGCAIRPLPQDFSGVSTPVIVKQIRCETRQAIIDLALGWLTAKENQDNHRVDPKAQAIGFEFQEGKIPIQQFDPKLFQGHVRDVIDTFYDAGVAYTFDLEMTETNIDVAGIWKTIRRHIKSIKGWEVASNAKFNPMV